MSEAVRSKSADYRFCHRCGSDRVEDVVSDGRRRPRCVDCGTVVYINPLPAGVALAALEGKLLLVKRGVQPEIGSWSLPGGFVEMGESPEEAVRREVLEETGYELGKLDIVGVRSQIAGYYGDVVVIGYSGEIVGGEARPGDDAAAVKFFPLKGIPPLAFPSHEELVSVWPAVRSHR